MAREQASILVPEANRIVNNEQNITILGNFFIGLVNMVLNKTFVLSQAYLDSLHTKQVAVYDLELLKYHRYNVFYLNWTTQNMINNYGDGAYNQYMQSYFLKPEHLLELYKYATASIVRNLILYARILTRKGYESEYTTLDHMTKALYDALSAVSKINSYNSILQVLQVVDKALVKLADLAPVY